MSSTILALDCSQRVSHLVLTRDAIVTARAFESTRSSEREAFWDELRGLLADARCTVADIEAIAVATGPGGFTGLRVAVAFAKAFALARTVPVLEISSAQLFAASDAARGQSGPWLVALAAKNESAWCARVSSTHDRGSSAHAIAAEEGAVLDASAFAQRVAELATARGSLLADEHLGGALCQCALEAGVPTRALAVDPSALAALARDALAQQKTTAPHALMPLYAREPEAVSKWRELHGAGE